MVWLTAFQKAVLILPLACWVAVDSLWIKMMVIHRGVYPPFYHRVMDRAQARFSTGFNEGSYKRKAISIKQKR